jgi:uncharacterized protein (TIGR00255 family)
MNSMTGFGSGTAEEGGVRVQVEVGSVNRKTLDVQVSLPRGLNALEPLCQKQTGRFCRRGRVHIKVEVQAANVGGVQVDRQEASRLLREINRFASGERLNGVTDVESLLRLPGFWSESTQMEVSGIRPLLEQALEKALQGNQQMRSDEGAHLFSVLEEQVSELENLLAEAEPLLKEARSELSERFRAAVEGVAAAGPDVEQRLLQEIALLTEKADVQEEFDRLIGHMGHFRTKMQEEGPVGRALDFLCQEMAREFHTLSVKTPHPGLNHLALQGKEGVERLREQVQNVE